MIKRGVPLILMICFLMWSVGWVSAAPTPVGRVDGPTIRPHGHRTLQSESPLTVESVTDGEATMWMDDTTITGVRLYMSAALTLDIHNNVSPWYTQVLHTMRPPNGGCLEGYVYHNRNGSNVMEKRFIVTTWCANNHINIYDATMDATWASKYLTVLSFPNWDWTNPVSYNDQVFKLKIEKIAPAASNCWQARLWNYSTSVYDTIGSPNVQCGTPNEPYPAYLDGWTSIEEHYATTTVCGGLGAYHVMESRQVEVQHAIGGAYSSIIDGVSFTDSPATRCQPAPWHMQYQTPFVGHLGAGIILCDPFLQPNCD